MDAAPIHRISQLLFHRHLCAFLIEMDARTSSCTGSVNTSTIYLNDPVSGSVEEKVTAGGAASFRDYILADGNV